MVRDHFANYLRSILALLCCSALWLLSVDAQTKSETRFIEPQFAKPRRIVTTDITNEPNDQESLVRLLRYANDFDIERLIESTGLWKLSDPAMRVIHESIDAYATVHPNRLLHHRNYPTAKHLHRVTQTGNRAYGMSGVGFRPSKTARLIINAVDRDDARPVWVLAWGGSNTIAQAIWAVRHERSEAELSEFLSKLRVYELAGQDQTTDVTYQNVELGDSVDLNALGSIDRNGDQLTCRWWVYGSAGTYPYTVDIADAGAANARLTAPENAARTTIHAVVTVRDSGAPSLTHYRRLVLSCVAR